MFIKVIIKFFNVVSVFFEIFFDDNEIVFRRMFIIRFEINVLEFFNIDERLYRVLRYGFLDLLVVEFDWRMVSRKGRSFDRMRGNCVFDSEEMVKSSCERFCFVDLFIFFMFFGSFDKIFVFSIKVLFLNDNIKVEV